MKYVETACPRQKFSSSGTCIQRNVAQTVCIFDIKVPVDLFVMSFRLSRNTHDMGPYCHSWRKGKRCLWGMPWASSSIRECFISLWYSWPLMPSMSATGSSVQLWLKYRDVGQIDARAGTQSIILSVSRSAIAESQGLVCRVSVVLWKEQILLGYRLEFSHACSQQNVCSSDVSSVLSWVYTWFSSVIWFEIHLKGFTVWGKKLWPKHKENVSVSVTGSWFRGVRPAKWQSR